MLLRTKGDQGGVVGGVGSSEHVVHQSFGSPDFVFDPQCRLKLH